jgi:hypothetical protein
VGSSCSRNVRQRSASSVSPISAAISPRPRSERRNPDSSAPTTGRSHSPATRSPAGCRGPGDTRPDRRRTARSCRARGRRVRPMRRGSAAPTPRPQPLSLAVARLGWPRASASRSAKFGVDRRQDGGRKSRGEVDRLVAHEPKRRGSERRGSKRGRRRTVPGCSPDPRRRQDHCDRGRHRAGRRVPSCRSGS